MKNNVTEINPLRHSHFVNGVRKVDGVAGFIRLQLIEIFEECAEEFECDYTELTVADIFEYLVGQEEEFQRSK
tara:strand:- start:88 stop:306 length:219 start_codon:yes stop_codon:yes gene_type:complete